MGSLNLFLTTQLNSTTSQQGSLIFQINHEDYGPFLLDSVLLRAVLERRTHTDLDLTDRCLHGCRRAHDRFWSRSHHFPTNTILLGKALAIKGLLLKQILDSQER